MAKPVEVVETPNEAEGFNSFAFGVRSEQYRHWYERGWRYAGGPRPRLEYGDRRGYPEPWYDGFLDRALEREKWHFSNCRLAGGCEVHRSGPGPTIGEFVELYGRDEPRRRRNG